MNPFIDQVLKESLKTDNQEIRRCIEQSARIIQYKKKEKIRRNGDPVSEVFICVDGFYKIVDFRQDGKEVLKCSNVGVSDFGFIVNPDFNLFEATFFEGCCIAITDCTVVAIPMETVRHLYSDVPEMKMVLLDIFRRTMVFYSEMSMNQQLDGMERYRRLRSLANDRWDDISNQDKALFMGMDYSYWMKLRKKHQLD